ncbi:beta-1,4-N-acetylgalactosaminyltransferase bre-4-like [Manduca sexta]|uniref:beta-1,4-N-acetylgalactosaminyltransferase bre-4-like n=1 Tax=Manduca sexta TaxID=7130 RepID=UPI00188F460A|nr:beta-1,4-N-acetylgalactosaminyltransferase bre-4-like [Manduca sexta]
MDTHHSKILCTLCPVVIIMLLGLQFYYNTSSYRYHKSSFFKHITFGKTECPNCTTYESFYGKNVVQILAIPTRPTKNIFICYLNMSSLGPISVNKTRLELEWVEKQHPQVKSGGSYAPNNCHSRHKIAILVPYRNRETNLIIFLYYIHTLLMKQLLEYRIFVIEQCAKDKFNKGTLFNIGFLESQRYGSWHCYIFHDVDLIPLDERILYHCPMNPTHMSAAVENHGFQTPYLQLFGGVTALTTAQYIAINGYSNEYWNWGAEDDDIFIRLQARRFPVRRYNQSIARYAALPHEPNYINYNRQKTLSKAKRRFWQEGLKSVKYRLLNKTNRKLFTHIVADVNPLNIEVK